MPDTLTISQFNPLTSTHMTFTRANDGGQETVNLSIPDTDHVAFPDINIRDEDQDQPLALTASSSSSLTISVSSAPVSISAANVDAPLNFSSSSNGRNVQEKVYRYPVYRVRLCNRR